MARRGKRGRGRCQERSVHLKAGRFQVYRVWWGEAPYAGVVPKGDPVVYVGGTFTVPTVGADKAVDARIPEVLEGVKLEGDLADAEFALDVPADFYAVCNVEDTEQVIVLWRVPLRATKKRPPPGGPTRH